MIKWITTAAVICSLLPGYLLADEISRNEESSDDWIYNLPLEELLNIEVYSVSKIEQSQLKAPQVVTVITPEDMRRFGLRTIHDALSLVPGFDIQRQHRTERIWTRGNRESVLALLDGVPIVDITDNQIHLDEAFQINNIKQIEVIRGPGGVLWGHNSFLGVINIITKNPGEKAETLINAAVASFSDRRIGFSTSGKIDSFGYFISGQYVAKKKDDVSYLFFSEKGTNKTSYWGDFFSKFTWETDFGNFLFQYREDKQQHNSPTYDSRAFLFTERPLEESDPVTVTLAQYDHKLSETFSIKASLSWLHREFNLFIPHDPAVPGDPDLAFDDLQHDQGILELEFQNILSENSTLIWGGSYENSKLYKSNLTTIPNDGSPPSTVLGVAHAKINRTALYGQLTHQWQDNLTSGIGIRWESSDEKFRHSLEGAYEKIDVDPQFLFNLNTVYQPDDNNTLKFIVSKGLRRPSIEQSSGRVPGFEGSVDVTEEEVISYEVDWTVKMSSSVSWRNNISYNDLSNLIDFRQNDQGRHVASNLDNAVIISYESEAQFRFENGNSGFVNANYKKGDSNGNGDFSVVNTNSFNFNAAYSHAITDDISWSNVLRYVSSKKDNHQLDNGLPPEANPPLRKIPGYITLDTGLIWQPSDKPDLYMSLWIYNALDEEYVHQARLGRAAYEDKQPGVNVALSVEYRF